MVEVNLKSLLARLDRYCSRSLEAAAGLCVSRTNYEVTTEHLMHALIDDATADVQQIFKQFGVDPGRVQKSLSTVIEGLKTGADVSAASAVGKLIAERAAKAGVKEVVFDRGPYIFHGRVKALAEAAREGGLSF